MEATGATRMQDKRQKIEQGDRNRNRPCTVHQGCGPFTTPTPEFKVKFSVWQEAPKKRRRSINARC